MKVTSPGKLFNQVEIKHGFNEMAHGAFTGYPVGYGFSIYARFEGDLLDPYTFLLHFMV